MSPMNVQEVDDIVTEIANKYNLSYSNGMKLKDVVEDLLKHYEKDTALCMIDKLYSSLLSPQEVKAPIFLNE